MFEQRDLKSDLLALSVLGLTIFVALALLTYDPADAPTRLVFPPNPHAHNVCGQWGASTASFLFTALGAGAYYVLVSLAVFSAGLIARRPMSDVFLRSFGWSLSVLGFTALIAMALPQAAPGPVIGSGGYLGAAGRALLEANFAKVGAYVVTLCVFGAGLLLSTDYLVLKTGAWIVRGPVLGLFAGAGHVVAAYAKKIGWNLEPAEPVVRSPRLKTAKTLADPADVAEPAKAAGAATADPAVVFSNRPAEAKPEPAVSVATPEEKEPSPETPAEPADKRSLASLIFGRKNKKDEAARQAVNRQLDAATLPADEDEYQLPTTDLLLEGEELALDNQEKEVRQKAKILEKTFASFGFNVRVVEIQTGPVIAQFEVELEAGLRLSKITGLADDLAIALRVPSVRIVAPIPGKNTVGVEIPNNERQIVRMREVIESGDSKAQKMRIPLYLGKDVAGSPLLVDLTTLPHLLIAGRTGTGKSVCLNSIIVSMVMTRRPDEVRMLMIDPKMVELSPYKSLPHLMHPVVTDMRKAEAILGWAVEKMEERYQLLARAGVRHLSAYNQLGEEELMERIRPETEEERAAIPRQMPYIVVVADEMADLMMTSAKEVETHIIRLAQKSRAVGIHLVLATQKPTVDVITGLIKSNLPARIAFQVASRTDSRVVLDEMGAERLLGNGDMLFLWPGTSTLLRGQGTYLTDDEINRVIASVATNEPDYVKELVQLQASEPAPAEAPKLNQRDELYETAVDIVIREGRGSVSLLQRALGIGYGRAARLVDFMAEDGIVGAYNGSQAREVVMSLADWDALRGGEPAKSPRPAAPAPPPRPSNRIVLESHEEDDDDRDETDDEEPPFDTDTEADLLTHAEGAGRS